MHRLYARIHTHHQMHTHQYTPINHHTRTSSHIIHTRTHITHTFCNTPRGMVITQYFARNFTSRYTNFFFLALHLYLLCMCTYVRATTFQMMIKIMTDRQANTSKQNNRNSPHTNIHTRTHTHTLAILDVRLRSTHITLSSNCYIRSGWIRHIEPAFNARNPMT